MTQIAFQASGKARAKGDKGFTLIELLVVVVILGVLIAIAIPLYLNYRKGANDAAAQSDLRNAISVWSCAIPPHGAYPLSVSAARTRLRAPVRVSVPAAAQRLSYSLPAAAGVSYVIGADHNSGGTAGEVSTATTAPRADPWRQLQQPTSKVVKIDSC